MSIYYDYSKWKLSDLWKRLDHLFSMANVKPEIDLVIAEINKREKEAV
jgi:hypothetical protein